MLPADVSQQRVDPLQVLDRGLGNLVEYLCSSHAIKDRTKTTNDA